MEVGKILWHRFGGFKWIILTNKNKVETLNIDEKTANKIQKYLIFQIRSQKIIKLIHKQKTR